MSKYLSKNNKLLVVSDTGIYKKANDFFAFGPVVKELEELTSFNEVTWIGFERKDQLDNSSYLKVNDTRIKTILLRKTGGNNILSKLIILLNYPVYFFIILKQVIKNDKIHVRAPSNPAVIAMMLSCFFSKKTFWFKYAGNWVGYSSPFYSFQKRLLKKLGSNTKVTVNGKWENQPNNVIAFENPCLDENDRNLGKRVVDNKKLENKINFCFVGGMNSNKGVMLIIQALKRLENEIVGEFHFVGDGEFLPKLKIEAKTIDVSIKFHGSLPKNMVSDIYYKSHFILLPSKSEGFPKVIGEAMNYGCIPIVSNISCIPQYIENESNGFLLNELSVNSIVEAINKSLLISPEIFEEMIKYNYNKANLFTYKFYEKQIKKLVFN